MQVIYTQYINVIFTETFTCYCKEWFNFLIHVFMLVNVFVQHPLFKLKCTSTYFLTFNI